MPPRTGGEWVVEALRAEGVRHVFGIPGVHNLAIYDALLRQSEITHVLARHEAGAGFMADGYARASGRPGVVVVTTGPGATNALTPLVESYAGSMPIVLVMSDVASQLVGRDVGALHEVPNQIECFKPVTRWAEAVTEAGAIPAAVHAAFDLLRTGRPGPIAISIPNDFLAARFEAPQRSGGHGRRPPCHVDEIRKAARLLGGAAAGGLAAPTGERGPGGGGSGWEGGWREGLRTAASGRYTATVARLIGSLRAALPDDAIVVNDQTGINYWMEWRFPIVRPRTFLYPVGSATLGYGVPAAIGAKIANPERPVVCVVGDGGFMYSVNELATAVKYRLPIVFLVMNDDRYGAT